MSPEGDIFPSAHMPTPRPLADIAVFLKSPFNVSAYSPPLCSADNCSSKFAMVPGDLAARLVF
ncbi:hypothetical protein D3C73_489740 [compost metagenome]